MRFSVKFVARAAIIAACYTALTLLLAPISYGMVQLRVAEALTLLPVLLPEAIPGLFAGCLLANLLGAATLWDVIFGSLATLIAAVLTRKLRANLHFASLMPVIANGVIVGPVVYYCYVIGDSPFSVSALALCCGSVAVGEAIACCGLGVGLIHLIKKTGVIKWNGVG